MKKKLFLLPLLFLIVAGLAYAQDTRGLETPSCSDIEIEEGMPAPTEMVSIDQEPVPVNMEEFAKLIEWPEAAAMNPEPTNIMYRILVNTNGEVQQYCLIKEVEPVFDESISKNLEFLEFEPAVNADGEPVACWLTLPVKFENK